jgi:hypothetical protein
MLGPNEPLCNNLSAAVSLSLGGSFSCAGTGRVPAGARGYRQTEPATPNVHTYVRMYIRMYVLMFGSYHVQYSE